MDGDDFLHDDAAPADETAEAFEALGLKQLWADRFEHYPPTRLASVIRWLEKRPGSKGQAVAAALRALSNPASVAPCIKALASGKPGEARALMRMVWAPLGLRHGYKIVSHRHRYLWIGVPRAATHSTFAALLQSDPSARLSTSSSVAEIYAKSPRVRGYFSFAFVRHPATRALSFHGRLRRAEAVGAGGGGHRHGVYTERLLRFPGLAAAKGFDGYCEWLNTPFGGDAFADRHYQSQHLIIRVGKTRLPDFVGRFESLPEGLARVAEHIGLPAVRLPMLNTAAGWTTTPEALRQARKEMKAQLSKRNKDLLKARYAEDFELFGYS